MKIILTSEERKQKAREYYQKNREKCLEACRKYRNKPGIKEHYRKLGRKNSPIWYAKNKERRYQYNKEWWKKQVKKLEEIAGRTKPDNCEICGKNNRICFDHDHKTGKFRGWICSDCNTILGKSFDDINYLKSLIEYLEKN